jgi:excisionase family DNA binding protein
MIIDLNKKVTIPEAAKILRVSRQYVHRIWKEGKINGLRIGRDIFLDKNEIIKLLDRRTK